MSLSWGIELQKHTQLSQWTTPSTKQNMAVCRTTKRRETSKLKLRIQTMNACRMYLQGLLIMLIIHNPYIKVSAETSLDDNWSIFEDFLVANHLGSGIICPCGLNRTSSYDQVIPEIIAKMKRLDKRISFVYPPINRGRSLHSHGVFMDTECGQLDKYLKLAVGLNLFGVQYKWLFPVGSEQFKEIISRFEVLDINVNSDINFAVGR